jgi:hypothetical protein
LTCESGCWIVREQMPERASQNLETFVHKGQPAVARPGGGDGGREVGRRLLTVSCGRSQLRSRGQPDGRDIGMESQRRGKGGLTGAENDRHVASGTLCVHHGLGRTSAMRLSNVPAACRSFRSGEALVGHTSLW